MNDRALIAAGGIGALLAALCCATPLLAVVLSGVGLSAWLAGAGYLVLPVLLLAVVVLGLGFYRRRASATCEAAGKEPAARS